MKKLAYSLLGLWVKIALFCYYKNITIVGRAHIPLDKAVMFLSNHQNALMDVLLIATRCGRKPWFLARSDVFANAFLQHLFKFLQMLPIYRLRDGRHQLSKNNRIFDECGALLGGGEAIVLFPEANHSLRRRVRPLSKGFTRIISIALEKFPGLDVQLVPVGQNYAYPMQVGDSAALHFGNPISVQDYAGVEDFPLAVKSEVFHRISKLTTHIPESDYETVVDRFSGNEMLFLRPIRVNEAIAEGAYPNILDGWKHNIGRLLKSLLVLWNFPMVLVWRLLLKPRVPEKEFTATFRFGFVLLMYPIFYLLGGLTLWTLHHMETACLAVAGHAVFNIILIKSGVTSSSRRK